MKGSGQGKDGGGNSRSHLARPGARRSRAFDADDIAAAGGLDTTATAKKEKKKQKLADQRRQQNLVVVGAQPVSKRPQQSNGQSEISLFLPSFWGGFCPPPPLPSRSPLGL